jgi:MoxR-like ATPase
MEMNGRYRGDGLPPDGNAEKAFPYLPGESLARAVNIAIQLGRPLLVKGPPGSGKTRVARAVAHELGLTLHDWYVKSTSRARDGLYGIDMVRRLQDATLDPAKAQRLTPYIRFGPLGEALRAEGESVVLIDEIDKADIDFPNDLLRELDEKRFTIEELSEEDLTPEEREQGWRRTYGGQARPIVVITSNDEKELPDAFLRRCVFHYINFPNAKRLEKIVAVNIPELRLSETLVGRAITVLERLRQVEGVRKKPETSELIDWVRILHHWGLDLAELNDQSRLADFPEWEILYKHQRDREVVRNAWESRTPAAAA